MSRGLALLFGAGASLVSVTLLLPHRDGEARPGLLIPVALAVVVTALLLAAPRRWPPLAHSLTLAFGSALIAVCVHYGGSAGGVYAFMFVWVALYAAAFFSVRAALAHLAWTAVVYAVVLATGDDVRPPSAQWLMAAGTSAVVSALVLALTRELRARAGDLATVSSIANQIGSASEVSGEQVAGQVCEGVRASTKAGAVVLLQETIDGGGLHVLGEAGDAALAAPFEQAAGIVVVDEAYRSHEPRDLHADGGVTGIVQPVRREGRVAGLLIVVWPRPRRRVSDRVRETISLFAAEAGVALERIARQSRDAERRALELNDEIVQGLVVAMYALRDGRVEMGERAVDETLDRARALVESQMKDLHGAQAPEPGSLRVRRRRDS
ncbi:MAG: hypothetical protein ACJ762_00430 [Solirubrobacteraceae bacterium]